MEHPDFSGVTRFQTAGGWTEIVKGSLVPATGVAHVVEGNIHHLASYVDAATAVTGDVRWDQVIQWQPSGRTDAGTRPEDMSGFRQPAGIAGLSGDATPLGLNRP